MLLIACGNAAILILARTATRWNEVAVRTVLGASRARIMGQLFVETLLLSLIATGIGLIAIDIAVAQLASRFPLPFWFDPNITPAFALKALGLSVLCAVVAGVLPALRATGGMLQSSIQSAGAGGSTLRLGRVAGALIVIEVGLAIVALFPGVMAWRLFQPNPDAAYEGCGRRPVPRRLDSRPLVRRPVSRRLNSHPLVRAPGRRGAARPYREPAGGARPPADAAARRAPMDVFRSTSGRGAERTHRGRGDVRRSGILCRA